MFYDFSIAVPPSTPETAPVITELELTAGVIHRVEVAFPAGCQGNVHLVITRGIHQIWPTNPQGDFAADDYTIPMDEHYPLDSEPYTLRALAWSTADLYTHTLTLRIGVLRSEDIESSSPMAIGIKKLLGLVGIKL